jgi:hypothetical protein
MIRGQLVRPAAHARRSCLTGGAGVVLYWAGVKCWFAPHSHNFSRLLQRHSRDRGCLQGRGPAAAARRGCLGGIMQRHGIWALLAVALSLTAQLPACHGHAYLMVR